MLIKVAIKILTKRTKRTGMGINQSGPNHAICRQAKIIRTLLRQRADPVANRKRLGIDPGFSVEIIKANLRQKVTIPWVILMGEVGPFTRYCAT